jgi:hypothetical protein
MPAVSGADVRPKRSYFHMLAVARHDDYTELRAHCHRLGKQGNDAIGRRVGADVIVRRLAPEQQIAHTASNQEGLMTFAN